MVKRPRSCCWLWTAINLEAPHGLSIMMGRKGLVLHVPLNPNRPDLCWDKESCPRWKHLSLWYFWSFILLWTQVDFKLDVLFHSTTNSEPSPAPRSVLANRQQHLLSKLQKCIFLYLLLKGSTRFYVVSGQLCTGSRYKCFPDFYESI